MNYYNVSPQIFFRPKEFCTYGFVHSLGKSAILVSVISSPYKALQSIYGSALLKHFLPTISILCYFLQIACVYAIHIFQNVTFPTCFRSSNWSFRHEFPSLDLLNIIILSHAFNMA